MVSLPMQRGNVKNLTIYQLRSGSIVNKTFTFCRLCVVQAKRIVMPKRPTIRKQLGIVLISCVFTGHAMF